MAKLHEAGHSADDNRQGVTALTADGSVTERPLEEGPFDEFYVSPEDKVTYGISSDEECYWARDPEYWMKHGELTDRVKQLSSPERRGGMEGRIILQEGDPVRLGGGTAADLVLMALPRRLTEKRQSEIDAAKDDYESELAHTDEGYEGYYDTLDRSTEEGKAVLRSRMRAEHQRNRNMGLIGPGSPTQKMTYTQAAAFIARTGRQQEVEDTARQLLMGGQHSEVNQEQFAALMTGQKALLKKSGKTVAMGNSGFPRNPNSAVEQSKRRAAAQKGA